MISLINNSNKYDPRSGEEMPNDNAAIAALLVGSGCMWVSYFISLSKPKHIKRAINAYNHY